MQEFNVIIYDFNKKKFIPYNIIPYLLECYYKEETPPQSLEEFKIFIKKVSPINGGVDVSMRYYYQSGLIKVLLRKLMYIIKFF